ncbi:MAG: hypothetical protein OXC12_18015 [Spirochaetaceae bacterium]|nr:hypothetical protein [Spirochaetaceae bacterium]
MDRKVVTEHDRRDFTDHYWTFGAGVASVGACAVFGLTVKSDLAYSAAITFAAISCGFTGTSIGILTASEARVMEEVRARFGAPLQERMKWSLGAAVVLAVLSLCLLVLDECGIIASAAWCGVAAFCVIAYWRLGNLMVAILALRSNESKKKIDKEKDDTEAMLTKMELDAQEDARQEKAELRDRTQQRSTRRPVRHAAHRAM